MKAAKMTSIQTATTPTPRLPGGPAAAGVHGSGKWEEYEGDDDAEFEKDTGFGCRTWDRHCISDNNNNHDE